jgi:hypothetical protein
LIQRTITTPTTRLHRHSIIPNPLNITEVDEDEDAEEAKMKLQLNSELVRSRTSISLPTTKKEVNFLEFHFLKSSIFFQLNVIESQEKFDESTRSVASKSKREMSIDKAKVKFRSFPIINPSQTLIASSKICWSYYKSIIRYILNQKQRLERRSK